MEFPERLSEWTYETVADIVRTHKYEPGRFDFKEVLNPTREDGRDAHLRSIRRTVCSMANTGGGFILFGVVDRARADHPPEARIVGVPLGDDLLKQFGDKLNDLQPDVHFEAVPASIPLPSDDRRGVFVVHVPESSLRPHMVRSEGVFYRRGDGGSAERMDYYEVRDQMLLTEERRRKATLLRLEMAHYIKLAAKIMNTIDENSWSVLRFDTAGFKLLLADASTLLQSNDVLERLLEIPIVVMTINGSLEQGSDPEAKIRLEGKPLNAQANLRVSIRTNLSLLIKLCLECEKRLNVILGPLTT